MLDIEKEMGNLDYEDIDEDDFNDIEAKILSEL